MSLLHPYRLFVVEEYENVFPYTSSFVPVAFKVRCGIIDAVSAELDRIAELPLR
jgi:hypothetical protein